MSSPDFSRVPQGRHRLVNHNTWNNYLVFVQTCKADDSHRSVTEGPIVPLLQEEPQNAKRRNQMHKNAMYHEAVLAILAGALVTLITVQITDEVSTPLTISCALILLLAFMLGRSRDKLWNATVSVQANGDVHELSLLEWYKTYASVDQLALTSQKRIYDGMVRAGCIDPRSALNATWFIPVRDWMQFRHMFSHEKLVTGKFPFVELHETIGVNGGFPLEYVLQ